MQFRQQEVNFLREKRSQSFQMIEYLLIIKSFLRLLKVVLCNELGCLWPIANCGQTSEDCTNQI